MPSVLARSASVPSPIDGVHHFEVVATDRVGNRATAGYEWSIDTSEQTWVTEASNRIDVMAIFADRARREGVRGVWLIRRPYEGTSLLPIPAELDALFPRRFRYSVRNTEIIYWAP